MLNFNDLNLSLKHAQVDGMVQEFADINRGMEKTGTFTMDKKKLLQLVGKANSNLADVIPKVGLFERLRLGSLSLNKAVSVHDSGVITTSSLASKARHQIKDAKYAQIHEYLRKDYEVAERSGNLDFKLKLVKHNIHFLQEILQNRKSDLLEWCIIGPLMMENVISNTRLFVIQMRFHYNFGS